MERFEISFPSSQEIGTLLYLAIDQSYSGYLVIADTLKEDAVDALVQLKQAGVKNTVMLTGDSKKIADHIGKQVGVDKIYSELLPEDKVQRLEEILQRNNKKTAFVGDGINDAPVLARADVGIAMGGLGSDAAIEAADVVEDCRSNPFSKENIENRQTKHCLCYWDKNFGTFLRCFWFCINGRCSICRCWGDSISCFECHAKLACKK